VLLEAIRDLKEASYDPDSFRAAARRAGLLRDGRRGKLAELSRIWGDYEAFLSERSLADESDVMRQAAEALTDGSDAMRHAADALAGAESAGEEGLAGTESVGGKPPRPCEPLAVYGFYDLNPLQKRLLEARIGAGGATVFFPYADVPAMAYARPTLDWFLSLGFELVELAPDPEELHLPKETIVISAPGEAREAREAVRTLRRLVEERDLSLQDSAIIVRTPEVHSGVLGGELDRLCDPGIEDRRLPERRTAFLESPVKLSRTRSGLSLLKLAASVRSEFSRADVIEFLSLAELSPAACGSPDEDPPVGDWNAISSLAGVTSGADGWLSRVRSLVERLEGEQDEFTEAHARLASPARRLLEVLERTVGPLAGMPPTAPPARYLDEITEVFTAVTCGSRERDEVLAALDGVRRLSELAGSVSFTGFSELVRDHLDAASPRGSSFGSGGPSVLSSMSARGLSYSVVVVPGLVEKQFPLTRRQDPVLLDFEREKLNRATGGDPLRQLPLRAPGIDEERLLFRLVAASATDVLVVTYPRLDPATARPRVPSIFVLDVLERLTGEKQDYGSLDVNPHVTRVPLSRRFPKDRGEALTRHEFDGCSILGALETGEARELAYLLTEARPLRSRIEMEDTRWANPWFTRYDGALSKPEALEAVASSPGFPLGGGSGRPGGSESGRPASATALEEYARCPFRFFAHKILGIEPPDEPEEALEFTPLDRGSLYHEVLERFMRKVTSSGPGRADPSHLKQLFEIADRAIDSGRWSLAGYRGSRRLERRSLRLNLAVWLRNECAERTDLLPAHFEVRFGGASRRGDDPTLSSERPVRFDAGKDIEVLFGGRIDRLDLSESGARARVVDYKTGNPKGVKDPLDRGRHLQLPVYLLAAAELLGSDAAAALLGSDAAAEPLGSDAAAELLGSDAASELLGSGDAALTPADLDAEYRFVTGGVRAKPVAMTRAELDARMDDLKKAVRCIAHGIASGMFFPPIDDSVCRNCDYAAACGSASAALSSMKQGDRNAKFYFEDLREIE